MKKENQENHYHWVCFSDMTTPRGQGSVGERALEGRVPRVGPLSKIKILGYLLNLANLRGTSP